PGVVRAHSEAEEPSGAPERATIRRDPVPRARDGADRRPAREVQVGRRRHDNRRRDRLRAEHPDGGGLHDSDPARTEGRVRATRPLAIVGGMVVEELELEFASGRVTAVQASKGKEVVESQFGSDENANRLGEVALVDGGSRVGQLGVTFYDTLFDENATCHIAWGTAYGKTTEDGTGGNESTVHTDLMIG